MTETDQYELASNWFKQLEQRDLEQLMSLYSNTRLSFHPTLWNEHIRDRARAREYFVSFLAKRPHLQSFEGTLLDLGEHTFLYAGTMILRMGNQRQDKKNQISARFSFVWTKEDDDQWRIIHHHNSVVPAT